LKRLIFTGPHCSGKTTRAKLTYRVLKALGLSVEFRREGVRLCPYPINEQGGYESQRWILDFYARRDLSISEADYVVMDRCALDTIPYSSYLYQQGRMTYRQYLRLINDAWQIYQKMPGEKVVFYNKPLPLVGDGVRSVNAQFRDFVAKEFEKLLVIVKDPIVTLGR